MTLLTTPSKPAENESLAPLPLDGLKFLSNLHINFYRCRKLSSQPLLVNDAKWQLDEEQLVEMKIRGEHAVLVQKTDLQRVANELLDCLATVLVDEQISLETRFALLQLGYSQQIEQAYHKSQLSKFVTLAEKVGDDMTGLARKGALSVSSLYRRLRHDSQRSTHLTNVAAYALAVAVDLETIHAEDLSAIAIGCLLHEVGKLNLPPGLLRKQGRLSTQDKQELERAPQWSYEVLTEFGQLNFGQLMMAYQQHERIDGTGYPVRTLATDIHPWAKLLSVVDEFDAITCRRPYRSGLSLEDGLLHLTEVANTQLDPEIVLCLITNSQSR